MLRRRMEDFCHGWQRKQPFFSLENIKQSKTERGRLRFQEIQQQIAERRLGLEEALLHREKERVLSLES